MQKRKKKSLVFDITYVPIIFYEHNGTFIRDDVIGQTKNQLNSFLDFAINTSTNVPDNPNIPCIKRKSCLSNMINCQIIQRYEMYKKGTKFIRCNNCQDALSNIGWNLVYQ